MALERPNHLPDYREPPLNEVVLGVQFTPAKGYSQIYAGDVWRLFKDRFPRVEEKEFLPPSFETFGLPRQSGPTFHLFAGPSHDRFWFLSETGDEIIQFQNDRLIHNWRRIGGEGKEYPRFESISESFFKELSEVESFFSTLSSQSIQITQCEVTYLNQILDQNATSFIDIGAWFPKTTAPFEEFSTSFRRVVTSDDGKPLARLVCDISSDLRDGKPSIQLNITMKGAPIESTIQSAIEFLKVGREKIVLLFTEITTATAHEKWGRVK